MNGTGAFPVETRILRPVAFAEGVTLLALVFIGMPMKHLFGVPELNLVLGPAHGVVFLVYAAVVLYEAASAHRSLDWLMQAGLASIIPGGTFWLFGGRGSSA
jgi:integral membrane protein